MKKVVKFGGSSLASAAQMKKSADIIKADPQRRYVIPSAPGKRFDGDTKVTDMLYKCFELYMFGGNYDEQLEKIKERWFARAVSRGKTGSAAEHQFNDVNSTAQIYIRPTMKNADIIINGLASAEYIEEITTRIINAVNDIVGFYK